MAREVDLLFVCALKGLMDPQMDFINLYTKKLYFKNRISSQYNSAQWTVRLLSSLVFAGALETAL